MKNYAEAYAANREMALGELNRRLEDKTIVVILSKGGGVASVDGVFVDGHLGIKHDLVGLMTLVLDKISTKETP